MKKLILALVLILPLQALAQSGSEACNSVTRELRARGVSANCQYNYLPEARGYMYAVWIVNPGSDEGLAIALTLAGLVGADSNVPTRTLAVGVGFLSNQNEYALFDMQDVRRCARNWDTFGMCIGNAGSVERIR